MIEVIKTTLDGCFLFKPKKIKDNRGYFFESYRTRWFFDIIKENVQFVQDNQSFSRYLILGSILMIFIWLGLNNYSEMIRYDLIWYDMIRFDMIWYVLIEQGPI